MDPFDTSTPQPSGAPQTRHGPPLGPDGLPLAELSLKWTKEDIEQRLGFTGERYTGVNRLMSFLLATLLSVAFYLVMVFLVHPQPDLQWLSDKFTNRGITPYPTVFFFFWAWVMLFVKGRKLAYQRRTLGLRPVPQAPDFVLNPETAREVLARINNLVDSPMHFILLNRIYNALSNLQNIGRVSDVSDVLKAQAEYDEDIQQGSYSLIGGFVWAIPVLGFIGTVIGLGQAIGAFGETLQAGGDMSALKGSLTQVTAGLSTSFDTTLIALVGALYIQLRSTFIQQREQAFLDECNDYCQKYVVSRLKLVDTSRD